MIMQATAWYLQYQLMNTGRQYVNRGWHYDCTYHSCTYFKTEFDYYKIFRMNILQTHCNPEHNRGTWPDISPPKNLRQLCSQRIPQVYLLNNTGLGDGLKCNINKWLFVLN